MAARIVVINDIEEILDAFRLILEDAGYEVIISGLAFRDTREIERLQPDLIILDYIFGAEKLGWQMVQLLRMNPKTARIPIIVSTAPGTGSLKLGQPVPLSNFSLDSKSGWSQPAQLKVPARFSYSRAQLPGRSVPWLRIT